MSLSDTALEEMALLERIRCVLPSDKYHDINVFEGERGGTRAVYTAKWGTGEKKVAVKLDEIPNRCKRRGITTNEDIPIINNG